MIGVMADVTSTESANQLTIEQLSAESGMTVRNIRSHQARGLLAPPEVRVRVGYYGPDHLEQLRLIRDLQDQGFNLNGIKRLLDDTNGTADRLARFREALSEIGEEPVETLTLQELTQRIKVSREESPAVLERGQRLGLIERTDDGHWLLRSPALLSIASEVVERGIPLAAALDAFEVLEGHCDAVAQIFVDLFLAQVWRPFEQAAMPPERWGELDDTSRRLLTLASQAVNAIFQRSMQEQIDNAFGVAGGSSELT